LNQIIDIQQILGAKSTLSLCSVPEGFLPLLLADLSRAKNGKTIFIAPDENAMRSLADTIGFFAPELDILKFPAWDCLPYDRASPSHAVTSERIATLHALQDTTRKRQLILTTAAAVVQRVLTPFRIRQTGARLYPGLEISREKLIELLIANGFIRVGTVAEPGEFAVRGGIIDLVPADEDSGLRIDLFGDEIESMRRFDLGTQRTIAATDSFALLPAVETLLDEGAIKRFRSHYREIFGATATGDALYQAISDGRRLAGMDHWLPLIEEKLSTVFDHISEDALILRDVGAAPAIQERFDAIQDYYDNRVRAAATEPGSYRPLPCDALYISPDDLAGIFSAQQAHVVTPFALPPAANVVDFDVKAGHDFATDRATGDNIYAAVLGHCGKTRAQGIGSIFACYSVGSRSRLKSLLEEHDGKAFVEVDSWQVALGAAAKGLNPLAILPVGHGFISGNIELLSEQDIFGDRLIRHKRKKKSADAFLAELAALSLGDLVVHQEHGIGRYEGLVSIPVGQSPHDCVALVYAGGDKLYVPVENLDVLSRYGSGHESVTLDRLGGEAWQRRRSKLKERIREIAHVLLRTAAIRQTRKAPVIEPDDSSMSRFTQRFPYEETDDQTRVISEVLDDLADGKPMDRLVCGDVGFGKTEVAMRAAFAVSASGYQVAIIAPTTLLARQHYSNFVDRFRDEAMNIGRLSRLVPQQEASKTREEMSTGFKDIVVGTHALLSKSISFKRLGLVIVDEEQRFGVAHKERLKELQSDVHMLTLTATPIPRTLQMALTGMRDLSVIQTPPVDRLAIRTYVSEWDAVVIREALLREHHRGGQSFFVVPRISDLEEIECFVRDTIPEVSFVTAHGQMSPSQIEERMSAFYDRKYDILISTTIVESGLDIPSANTLIVHRAERFGLAQLYQLRGRVGRSKIRAYAYLTTPPNRVLNEIASKRLRVLGELDSLGAGFQLASHDLDIRGSGNLLGDEQSGHVKEVGIELYQSMLEDAIAELRAEGQGLSIKPDRFSPQITVDAPILIPEDYVPDLSVRMALYRQLNDTEDAEQLEQLAVEMTDRFGILPTETRNLIRIIEIKQNALTAKVSKIDVGAKGTLVSFHNDTPPDIDGLLRYVEKLGQSARLRPDGRLIINRFWPNAEARLNGALQLSKGLAGLARKAMHVVPSQ
jgi:transcription-repair coupling factor (superfamily II helicase)